jgi:LPPG:FO 2-phospho-L-lactate transferase
MSDDPVRTMVTRADNGREVEFQEYFVRERHGIAVTGVRFAGVWESRLSAPAATALADGDAVVIAPSNPIVSIGPIRSLAGVDEALSRRRDSVVAISPIVGGAALKGPADRMLVELGHEASVVGVARLYAPVAATLVIDPVDAHLADAVEVAGMRAVVCPSVMSDPAVAAELARTTLAAALSG